MNEHNSCASCKLTDYRCSPGYGAPFLPLVALAHTRSLSAQLPLLLLLPELLSAASR